jgi:phosphatidylinositol alpha-1,6-mannosyltransferase
MTPGRDMSIDYGPRPASERRDVPLAAPRGVALVAHSQGLGGGIERYVATVEDAIRGSGSPYTRLNLHDHPSPHVQSAGPRGHWTANRRLLTRLRQHLDATGSRRLVLGYLNLLPVALLATRQRPDTGITVVLHGSEIWAQGLPRRLMLRLLSSPRVRPVAVSGFSAGALFPVAAAGVLPPGLSAPWFDTLTAAGRTARPESPGVRIMTSFRLESWRDKGLPELLAAIRRLGRPDLSLVVCGSGPVPADLQRLVAAAPFCTVRSNLSDPDLAAEFAAADLFVLATRLRSKPLRSGEGFGLVLAEAQVAGTPVIAPAYGGGSDALRPGITGAVPVDESVGALATVIERLVQEPDRLARLGRAAAAWAGEEFDPARYATRVRETLL